MSIKIYLNYLRVIINLVVPNMNPVKNDQVITIIYSTNRSSCAARTRSSKTKTPKPLQALELMILYKQIISSRTEVLYELP